MRKYRRLIAKARMKALGIRNPNRRMRQGLSNRKNRSLQRTMQGRRLLEKIREKEPALWRRVLTGDLAESAKKAQAKKERKKAA